MTDFDQTTGLHGAVMDKAAPPDGTPPKHHYLVLDALRGVAAIGVLAFHGHWWLTPALSFQHGYLAVDFFFMLSGFVIDYAYGRRLAAGTLPFMGFVRVRAIRLYPLIFIGTTLGLIVQIGLRLHHEPEVASVPRLLAAYPLGALAIPVWGYGRSHYVLNWPTWSLGCEIVVNLAYAMTVRWLTSRTLSVIALLSLATLTYWALHYGAVETVGAVDGPIVAIVARTIFPFSVGILLRRLHAAGRLHVPRLGLAGLTGLLCASFMPTNAMTAWPGVTGLYDLVCIAVLYPAIIASACQVASVGMWERAARFSAALSYPLYALHEPFVDLFSAIIHHLQLRHRYQGGIYILLMMALIPACRWAAMPDARIRRRLAQWAARPESPRFAPVRATMPS